MLFIRQFNVNSISCFCGILKYSVVVPRTPSRTSVTSVSPEIVSVMPGNDQSNKCVNHENLRARAARRKLEEILSLEDGDGSKKETVNLVDDFLQTSQTDEDRFEYAMPTKRPRLGPTCPSSIAGPTGAARPSSRPIVLRFGRLCPFRIVRTASKCMRLIDHRPLRDLSDWRRFLARSCAGSFCGRCPAAADPRPLCGGPDPDHHNTPRLPAHLGVSE